LTLYWNKVKIAENDIFNGHENFTIKQLQDVFEMALVRNNFEFVKLLIENKLDIDKFLTKERLVKLYETPVKDLKEAPFKYYLRSNEIKWSKKVCSLIKKAINIDLEDVFFEKKETNNKYYGDSNSVNAPEVNLFIWSILFNKPQVARILLLFVKVIFVLMSLV
jgi:hypothetical protein